MGRQVKSRKFHNGDVEFELTVTQFEAMQGLPLAIKVGQIIGPALSQFIGFSGEDEVEELVPAIQSFFSTLKPAEITELVRELLGGSHAIVNGKMIDFVAASTREINEKLNAVFGSSIISLIKACAFSVEVNFRDFFDLLRGLNLAKPVAKLSSLTKQSSKNGESGDSTAPSS